MPVFLLKIPLIAHVCIFLYLIVFVKAYRAMKITVFRVVWGWL